VKEEKNKKYMGEKQKWKNISTENKDKKKKTYKMTILI
jgi:hypothetical protein